MARHTRIAAVAALMIAAASVAACQKHDDASSVNAADAAANSAAAAANQADAAANSANAAAPK